MSGFRWEVCDATEDVASVSPGGTVDLQDAKVAATVPPWRVQPPDGSVALVPQPSGEVELADKHTLRSSISLRVLNFAVIVMVVVTGFILVVDAWRGNVTFEKFLYVLTPFMAGFTAGHVNRTK